MELESYFAVSLDLYNKKEYIIYSIGGIEIAKVRELGELLFDFADQTDKPERYNAAAEYLTCFSEKKITPLLTDNFFETQRHLHLNGEHRYSSYDVIDGCSDKHNKSGKLAAFYVDDKLYMAVEDNFELLLQYYLDVIYSIRLFPRKCMSCNSFFLSGKKHGDVLCSEECRKKKKSQNTMAYYGKLSENEALYKNLYRKWKQRIDRAEEKHTIGSDGIAQLRQELKELTEINRTRAKKRKRNEYDDLEHFDKGYFDALNICDRKLYELFDALTAEKK